MVCTPMVCTPMVCTPMVCTPMVCTPMVCTPMVCIPMGCLRLVCIRFRWYHMFNNIYDHSINSSMKIFLNHCELINLVLHEKTLLIVLVTSYLIINII
jgi:hypothetical protein